MKKVTFLCFVTTVLSCYSFSQVVDPKKLHGSQRNQGNIGNGQLPQISLISDMDIFPQPNYQGTAGRLKTVNGKVVAPFDLTHVSFRVPAGKIIYIKTCIQDFPSEAAYDADQANINLTGICGVRSDDASGFTIQFNGISTVIHNNDCKRIFGSIKIIVFETAPGSADVRSSARLTTAGTAFRGTGAESNTFIPFKNSSSTTTPPYGGYVQDAAGGIPVVTTIVGGSGTIGQAVGSFRVGASALRDGRVSIFITSDIASAHKTCDLCDDFSSNVHMAAPITTGVPLNNIYDGSKIINASNPRFVLGPYHAHGSRDGVAVTASAGTDIDFRVHFTVTGL